jgi:hypothetical protein
MSKSSAVGNIALKSTTCEVVLTVRRNFIESSNSTRLVAMHVNRRSTVAPLCTATPVATLLAIMTTFDKRSAFCNEYAQKAFLNAG